MKLVFIPIISFAKKKPQRRTELETLAVKSNASGIWVKSKSVPPDLIVLAVNGRLLWAELHRKTDATPEWFATWLKRVPCGECRDDAKKILNKLSPTYGKRWFAFTVAFHNAVNKKLHKPEISEAEARRLWSR